MNRIDGRNISAPLDLETDVVIVGSGPAGAAVAQVVAGSGARVVVVEEGHWVQPDEFPVDALSSFARHYRDMGTTVMHGPAMVPYIQGRAVGGSSVINGAICWKLPQDVYAGWIQNDPGIEANLAWADVSAAVDQVETDLNVQPTAPAIAGAKNTLLGKGAEALGLEHRPIRRNVRGCKGLGRCLQGCPDGNKLSMDRSFLVESERHGAIVASGVRVLRVIRRRGKAVGVIGRSESGHRVRVTAGRAVVLAASAIQTPALLRRSGIRHGPVGDYLQCHPGVAVSGEFEESVRMWEGATQGHEVIGLRSEGLKFEALGFGIGLLAGRLPGVGTDLARAMDRIDHYANWGAAVRATGQGRVRPFGSGVVVRWAPTQRDVQLFRRGLVVLGRMMFAAGARSITLDAAGWSQPISDPRKLDQFETEGPLRASAYTPAATHLFGTCRMGSDPRSSVVRPDFRHHRVDRLYVADSSVFPTNTGVNPQIAISALATLCGRNIVA